MVNQRGFSLLILIVAILFITGISIFGVMMFMDNKPEEKTSPAPSSSPVVMAVKSPMPEISASPNAAYVYKSDLLHIKFNLKQGERVVVCPEDNQTSDSYSIQITTDQSPQPDLCLLGDSDPKDVIYINKIGTAEYFPESSEEYITQLEQDYDLSETKIELSGVNAFRVVGDLKEIAPLPDSLDKVLLVYKGFFYKIDATYLQRGLELTL